MASTHHEDPHGDFARAESAALEPDAWDRWIARVEKLCGHSLDGDRERDGYSLDCCLDLFRAGKRPLDALHIILWRKHGLHR